MKKIAIVGFGSEGLSAYNYFMAKGESNITIYDEHQKPNQPIPKGAAFVGGPGCFDDLTGYDIVMRFPGIAPNRIHTNGQVSSVIKEFFKACPAPVIGVTGSKGKTTTSSLIHLALQNAGLRAHLAGNIGVPALDILPQVQANDVVVLELSSFQLWDATQSPHVAVVVMMEPDHLDAHSSLDDYIAAKANITRWQKPADVTIYLPGNALTERVALQGKGQKIPYTKAPGAHVQKGNIVIDEQIICATSQISLPGNHNIDNACAAVTAAWQFTKDAAAIAKALREFTGLPHRLKFVREVNGISYYDDSIATTATSAVAAMNAFSAPKILILGGWDKGTDYNIVARRMTHGDVRGAVVIGNARDKIIPAIEAANFEGALEMFDEHATMSQIVAAATAMAKPGDAVVLSPACASFDMFKNYKDRGDQFIAAVQKL